MALSEETLGTGARFTKLLQALAEGDTEFSLKDLAARLGLPTSTVHRLLQLLVSSGMVERGEGQGYRLGPELFRIASLIWQKFDVPKIARPLLQELWTEYQETCSFCLYMPSTHTGMVVEAIPSPQPVRFVSETFVHRGLVWGSLARSILAFLPDEDFEAVMATAAPGPISHRSPPSREQMKADVELIRQRGYAIQDDRAYPDVGGIAAPVFDRTAKVVGSIGVLMPGARLEGIDKAAFGARIAQQAARLSSLLGFNGEAAPVPRRRAALKP